ncbi:hypothetical protein C8034_v008303 [Colletotrichum sidae]|uniref:Uncharacterized protein n=1 Tax=Colletotrichum sidae TaxID=1347389 RepID=A0A4R8T2P0_9PEZI|nr:hypothetical protein C8034_v008303 [Colletotrichum sidae]
MGWRKVLKMSSYRGSRPSSTASDDSYHSYTYSVCSSPRLAPLQRPWSMPVNTLSIQLPGANTNISNHMSSPPDAASMPEPQSQYRSVILLCSFLNLGNNVIPVRITDEFGMPIGMLQFLNDATGEVMTLIRSHSRRLNLMSREDSKTVRSMLSAYGYFNIRWDLGGDVIGQTALPLLDRDVAWTEAVKLMTAPGARHCVLMALPRAKDKWLRDNILSGEFLRTYASSESSEEVPVEPGAEPKAPHREDRGGSRGGNDNPGPRVHWTN